ncbi:hypothetical protein DRE_03813 [Drechslerella stenobrocha 248]|uniref:ATP-dependent RNA helicase n=1 Tax=Drechslerella stenobrocha 248 TaxID=1043628 RepID=W7HSN7_9PEZI|nr:hypothetical protein DRE_03813 [Drechslerella stenobrocha 248]
MEVTESKDLGNGAVEKERFNPRERGSRDERFDPRERGNREERFGAQNRDGRPPPESEGKREFVSPFRDRGPIDPLRAERRQLAADLEQQAAGRANDRYGERFDRRGDNRSSGDFHSDSRPAPNRLAYRPVDGLPGKPVFDSAAKSTHTRPPIRRFAQMKQIASLDHVSSSSREITKEALQRHSAFDTFDFLPQTMSALQKDGLPNLESLTPTPVQSLAIPELISKDPAPPSRASPPKPRSASKPAPGEVDDPDPRAAYQTYLVAAETGSGKTLAYLLPMMDTIKRREMAEQAAKKEETQKRAEAIREPNSRYMYDIESPPVNHGSNIAQPAAVILVPTSELVFQVGALLRKLTYELKLRTEMISRDFSGSMIRRRLFGETRPDIIVGTPFMIDRITEANPEMLARTSYIIVDEADSLFDRSFSPLTSAIIPRAINLEKLVLCSATIPKSLDAYVTRKFPDCKRLVTAGLHAVPRRVQMQIVNVEGEMFRGNKLLACAALLDEIAKDGTEPGYKKRVVVFVNERETTLTVAAYLEGKGFDAVEINRDSDSRRVLETFIGPREEFPEIADGPEGEGEGKTSSVGRRRQGVQVLVTTDLASRGIDTKAVRNVVLYDVPYTSIDFIHRLGRTGRMGRRGRAWVLVDKSSNEEYVKEVKKTMHLGQALI